MNRLFQYGSPLAMCVYRILIGALAFVNSVMTAFYFEDFYTEKGYTPVRAVMTWEEPGMHPFNPFITIPDSPIVPLCYGLMILAALFTCLGLYTRISSVALFVLTVAFSHRNPVILHGGDTLLRQGIFLVCLMPAGLMLSLDRKFFLKDKPVPRVSLWPQYLVQYQVALMYFTTFILKMTGTMWPDGTAAWYPTRLTEFDRFPTPEFLRTAPFIQIQTYGTLVIWAAMGSLVFWRPARNWVLLGAMSIHLAIEYQFNIPLFAFIAIAQYVAFFDSSEVSTALRRLTRGRLALNV